MSKGPHPTAPTANVSCQLLFRIRGSIPPLLGVSPPVVLKPSRLGERCFRGQSDLPSCQSVCPSPPPDLPSRRASREAAAANLRANASLEKPLRPTPFENQKAILAKAMFRLCRGPLWHDVCRTLAVVIAPSTSFGRRQEKLDSAINERAVRATTVRPRNITPCSSRQKKRGPLIQKPKGPFQRSTSQGWPKDAKPTRGAGLVKSKNQPRNRWRSIRSEDFPPD